MPEMESPGRVGRPVEVGAGEVTPPSGALGEGEPEDEGEPGDDEGDPGDDEGDPDGDPV
ncbi:hypothetical protein [Actinopolymorpha singaporensis]|uniref:hypothetical protein n=1 Tax=Actinopolymorpha singaporensis TaxID=117157 RepID=UPI001561AD13|nr:hypothetical protein [Actinopolymorpha singaporensis]